MGGGGGSAPKSPKFIPVDAAKTQAMAEAADRKSYALSDADYAKRQPDLVAGREADIAQALGNLHGNDTAVKSAENQANLGDVNLGDNEFERAKLTGHDVLDMEKRDRGYFQNLLGMNPQRQIGLSGQDATKIAVANSGSQNALNQGLFATRVNNYNYQQTQNAQNTSGYLGLGLSALGDFAKVYQGYQNYNSPSLSYGNYLQANPSNPAMVQGGTYGGTPYYNANAVYGTGTGH